MRRPSFVKPPNDKTFPARIYPDSSPMPGPDAVDDYTAVLASYVVTFAVEYRLFAPDGHVRMDSRYLTGGRLDVDPFAEDRLGDEVVGFAGRLTEGLELPWQLWWTSGAWPTATGRPSRPMRPGRAGITPATPTKPSMSSDERPARKGSSALATVRSCVGCPP